MKRNWQQINLSQNKAWWGTPELSQIEFKLFREFEDLLISKGFEYLSIPSLIDLNAISKQGIIPTSRAVKITDELCLSGSAEQGILQRFENTTVPSMLLWAKNQCYRLEDQFYYPYKLLEFTKLEQFCFCYENEWEERFYLLLDNARTILDNHNISYNIVDVTIRDPGYHKKKFDIEIYTKKWGLLETHSCTYFGTEQCNRFRIDGANHTISNTGLASPRMLIPFMERLGLL